ncbi:MAG: hypothetical protein ACR2N5_01320, partial [Solirubrobacterales bacterium]
LPADQPGSSVSAERQEEGSTPGAARRAFFPETGATETPVLSREEIASGSLRDGPCLIEEAHTTIVVPPGDTVEVDAHNNLVIVVGAA